MSSILYDEVQTPEQWDTCDVIHEHNLNDTVQSLQQQLEELQPGEKNE